MALILYCPCVNTLFKIASLVYRKLDEEGKSDSEDDGSESYDSHNDENNSKTD